MEENQTPNNQQADGKDAVAAEKINTELAKFTLEEETKIALRNHFLPFLEKAEEWKTKAFALVVTDATQLTEMAQAREGRLILKNIRTSTEKLRKSLKEDSLKKGKAIDGVANFVKDLIEPIEEHLDKQERFAEIKEAERKEALKVTREGLLTPLGITVEFYNLAEMDEPSFQALLQQSQNQLKAKQDAERKAVEEQQERERKEKEEQERVRLENERLQKEAAEKENQLKLEREATAKREAEMQRQMQAEREEAARKQRELEEKAKQEREAAEAKAKEERDQAEKERAAIEAKAKEEKEAAELAAKEQQRKLDEANAQREAEKKKAEEAQAKEQAEKKRADEAEAARKREEDARIAAEASAKLSTIAANVGENTPTPITPAATTHTSDLFPDLPSQARAEKRLLVNYAEMFAKIESPIVTSPEAKQALETFNKYIRNSCDFLKKEALKLQ